MGYLPDNTSTRNSSIATIAARSLLTFAEHPTPIGAELSGNRRCSAEGLTVNARAPFLAMARKLIAAGYDPHHVLEAYRGTTLCLRAQLGAAAQLTIEECSDGIPRFRPYHRPGSEVSPPVAPNDLHLAEPLQKTPSAGPRRRGAEGAAHG